MEDRERLIKRIVEEKGEKAILILIDLLFEEDSGITDLASDALMELDCCKGLIQRFDLEIRSGEKKTGIFYIADLLGEKGCAGSIDRLKKLLNLVEDEKELLIVHGALLKLGFKDSENYLLYELEEDPYMEEFILDIAIALSHSDDPKIIKTIIKKAQDHEEIIDVLQSMCERNPSLYQLIPEEMKSRFTDN